MKKLGVLTLALIATGIHAQAVTEIATDPEYLAEWLSRGTTIEVRIPANATVFALNLGTDTAPFGLATFLEQAGALESNTLRLVVVPPDHPGGDGVCGDEQGLATLFVTQVAGGRSDTVHHVPFCVPYPNSPNLSSRLHHVFRDTPAALDVWTPIYVHAWLLGRSADEVTLTLPVEQAFSIQVSFLSGNATTFPNEPPPNIEEILGLAELAGLIDRYEVIGAP